MTIAYESIALTVGTVKGDRHHENSSFLNCLTFKVYHILLNCTTTRLAYHYTRHVMNVRVYRADAETCNRCPLKAQCTTSSHGRTIHRNLREHYIERGRAYHQTQAYEKAMG